MAEVTVEKIEIEKKATVEVEVEETTAELEQEKKSMLEAARKVLLASVGAVVIASESAEKTINRFFEDAEQFVNKLIERGEIAEKDGRELINEMIEKRRHSVQEVADKARTSEATLANRMDELTSRINVPSRQDLNTLTQKINILNRKVEQLRAREVAEDQNVEVVVTEVNKHQTAGGQTEVEAVEVVMTSADE